MLVKACGRIGTEQFANSIRLAETLTPRAFLDPRRLLVLPSYTLFSLLRFRSSASFAQYIYDR